jgi:hypothetical protein
MRRKFEIGVYDRWAWEATFGPLPRHRKRHSTLEEASAESKRLARAMLERGDGRGIVLVFEDGQGIVATFR